MKRTILIGIFSIAVFLVSSHKACTAESSFTPLTPKEAARNISVGWTLGNTLDARPEIGWNVPHVEEYIFDDIRKAGFKTIRIPVTWNVHIGPAPDYKVDSEWFDRVEEVVDWALKRGFYVILNAHHDNDWLSKMTVDPETGRYVNTYENNIGRFDELWKQIAERFKGKSEKLLFQILNEPNAGQWESTRPEKPTDPQNPAIFHDLTDKQMVDLNNRILKIIRSSGGYNDKRLVLVGWIGNDSESTLKFFQMPDDKYIILAIQYFAPWQFLQGYWGTTTWGTKEDKKKIEDIFERLYETFIENHLFVVISEWGGTSPKINSLPNWRYHDYFSKTAYKYGIPCIIWDGGKAYFDRKNRVWRDKILIDITVNAGLGIPNSFISPVDNYFKIDTAPEKQLTVELELNGNQFFDIYNGEDKLVKDLDYIVDTKNSNVIIGGNYIAKLLKSQKLGTVATLRFDFSKGVDMLLNIIRYDLPKFQENSITIKRGDVESDIVIPVSFNGTKLARVSLVDEVNKKSVKRDWTPYLDMFRDFDYDENTIILKKEILNKLESDSLFTFEFWPEGVKVEVKAKLSD